MTHENLAAWTSNGLAQFGLAGPLQCYSMAGSHLKGPALLCGLLEDNQREELLMTDQLSKCSFLLG